MKTLLERLKPELLAKMEDEGKAYPFAVKALLAELKNNTYVMDMTYGSVISMSNFLGLRDYSITEILNLFDPTENQEALKVKAEELLKVKI
jgi:hypothetical protein